MRQLITLLLFVVSLTVSAGQQQLIKVETKGMTGGEMRGVLYALTDDSTGKATKFKLVDNTDGSVDYYTPAQLKNGVVMKRMSGKDVIILKSVNLDTTRGGFFDVKYLVSGITNRYNNVEYKIELNNGKWDVFYQGRDVNKITFVVRKTFGQAIGIKQIINN